MEFFIGHLPHVEVGILHHRARRGDVGDRALITLETGHHRIELGIFFRQIAETLLRRDHVRIGEERIELLQPFGEGLQFAAYRGFHAGRLRVGIFEVEELAGDVEDVGQPSKPAWRMCTLGECISLLVRARPI